MIKKMKYYFAKNVFLAVVLIVIFTEGVGISG